MIHEQRDPSEDKQDKDTANKVNRVLDHLLDYSKVKMLN